MGECIFGFVFLFFLVRVWWVGLCCAGCCVGEGFKSCEVVVSWFCRLGIQYSGRLFGVQSVRRFTRDELRAFNGADGKPVYVALGGKVYDLSSSRFWSGGKHQGRHSAGYDLSMSILNAPHNDKVLSRFPVVGELLVEESAQSKVVGRLQRLHLHPISVHFSIAYSIALSLLSILTLITGVLSFETASYYMLLLGLLSAPVTALSGLFSWKVNYKTKRNKLFSRKLSIAPIFLVVISACFLLTLLNSQILVSRTVFSYFYLTLALSLTPIVIALGYYGGKIVYE